MSPWRHRHHRRHCLYRHHSHNHGHDDAIVIIVNVTPTTSSSELASLNSASLSSVASTLKHLVLSNNRLEKVKPHSYILLPLFMLNGNAAQCSGSNLINVPIFFHHVNNFQTYLDWVNPWNIVIATYTGVSQKTFTGTPQKNAIMKFFDFGPFFGRLSTFWWP